MARTRKLIEVDEVVIRRFLEIYPQHGALTWFVNRALEHFNELHTLKPDDFVKEAVEAALKETEVP